MTELGAGEPQGSPPALRDGQVRDDGAVRGAPVTGAPGGRRPLIERLGMAAIAVAIALAFGAIAAAFLAGSEPIFAAMAALGGLMTLWAGAVTLIRG